MSQPRDERQDDLFGPPLEKIINLRHPLVRLAGEIDWAFLAQRFSAVCRVGPGQPPLPTQLLAVNAGSIFPTCAEVKFPRRRVAVISRLDDLGLHFWVADRGGAAAVPGLAS
jgi:hypothetical protein